MYSESDLQSAVDAGAISEQAAQALRSHVSTLRHSPVVDEEHFRLLTGFNDIFVSIAVIILLVAVGWIGNDLVGFGPNRPSIFSGLAIAATAWGLAEYFTRRRRMALPSIVLLLGFVGGVAVFAAGIGRMFFDVLDDRTGPVLACFVAAVAAGATWVHWKRFMVPITVAAGAVALAATAVSAVSAMLPDLKQVWLWATLLCGIAVFLLAMHWDTSDRARTTRRSDVAFWLHLAAAPMIAHSIFQLLGVFDDHLAPGTGVIVLLLYALFGLVALAIDRRALLVSSLAYVLYALYALFERVGAIKMSAALTALVIGSALLLLSALWHRARAAVVGALPEEVTARLPYLDREAVPA